MKSEWEKIEGRVGTTPLEPSKNFRALCLNVKVAERVYVMKFLLGSKGDRVEKVGRGSRVTG